MAAVIEIPTRAMIVLCGPSAAGKSTWSRRHFASTQIISSDHCRHMVSDGLNWQEPAVSNEAFDLLYTWTEKRLRLNRLAIVDSTALMTGTRRRLLKIARDWSAPAILVTFDLPLDLCLERDQHRESSVGRRVLKRQVKQLANERMAFEHEGWDAIHSLTETSEEESFVKCVPLSHERPNDSGPFDIIGDIHGCKEELDMLLARLGWVPDERGLPVHPQGRRAIFVGDIGCGGPDTVGAWMLALRLQRAGRAEILLGDHDVRFARLLLGRSVNLDRGLDEVELELQAQPTAVIDRLKRGVSELMAKSPPHLVLDRGQLAVAHAALPDHMVGKESRRIRDFCRHAEGPFASDRGGWIREHLTHVLVVHGHSPVRESKVFNHTLNIDTGCVLGGKLTAFRWPERETVDVPALSTHWHESLDALPKAQSEENLESMAG